MSGQPQVQLVLVFNEELLGAIIGHPLLGPGAWKDFVSRLLDANIIAPSWEAGSPPPPVVVSVRVKAGTDLAALGGDHFPVDVEGWGEAAPDLPPHCELAEVVQAAIRVVPVRCELVFDKT
jgi:hypothetical protein